MLSLPVEKMAGNRARRDFISSKCAFSSIYRNTRVMQGAAMRGPCHTRDKRRYLDEVAHYHVLAPVGRFIWNDIALVRVHERRENVKDAPAKPVQSDRGRRMLCACHRATTPHLVSIRGGRCR